MKYDVRRINKARRRRGAEPLPEPRRGPGRPPGRVPSKDALAALYVEQRLSLRATAAALNVNKDAVRRALVAYGIERHERVKPSRLAVYGVTELRRRVQADGLRATARALDVSPPTLLDFIRRHTVNK